MKKNIRQSSGQSADQVSDQNRRKKTDGYPAKALKGEDQEK